jgi:hypothetical protein
MRAVDKPRPFSLIGYDDIATALCETAIKQRPRLQQSIAISIRDTKA